MQDRTGKQTTDTTYLLKIKPFNCTWHICSFTLNTSHDTKWMYGIRARSTHSHLTEPTSKAMDVARAVHVSGASWFYPLSPYSMLN